MAEKLKETPDHELTARELVEKVLSEQIARLAENEKQWLSTPNRKTWAQKPWRVVYVVDIPGDDRADADIPWVAIQYEVKLAELSRGFSNHIEIHRAANNYQRFIVEVRGGPNTLDEGWS